MPDSDRLAKADSHSGDEGEALKGVAVADLDAQSRRQFNIPDTVRGAIVKDVEPGSAAAEAGLEPGDVILEINKQPVKGAEDAVRLTENPKDKTTLLRLWRQGSSRFLVVDESNAG